MSKHIVPASVSDVLLHLKNTDNTEVVMMPFTRYDNVFNAPLVTSDTSESFGAPFVLFSNGEETMSDVDINRLCGKII